MPDMADGGWWVLFVDNAAHISNDAIMLVMGEEGTWSAKRVECVLSWLLADDDVGLRY